MSFKEDILATNFFYFSKSFNWFINYIIFYFHFLQLLFVRVLENKLFIHLLFMDSLPLEKK